MGSVKDEVKEWPRRIPATPTSLGLSLWRVKGTFSVRDLKHLIPSFEIAQKAEQLAMTTSAYWEAAAEVGFQSTYVGMLDQNDEIVDVKTLLERGETSHLVVMRSSYTPHDMARDVTEEIRTEYHRRIAAGEITCYVADAENIFRFGVPLGSSVYKNLAKAAGLGVEYSRVATYDQTVEVLNGVRGVWSLGGDKCSSILSAMGKAGLDFIPNPGFLRDYPVFNYDTKFCPAGDLPLTLTEVQRDIHLSDLVFRAWMATFSQNAVH